MGEIWEEQKERRCSSADFCGGPSNISPDAAGHMVKLGQKLLLKLQELYF